MSLIPEILVLILNIYFYGVLSPEIERYDVLVLPIQKAIEKVKADHWK